VDVEAVSDGEVMRLSYDAFESLSARNPALARHILLDLGRILAARLRAGDNHTPGWTG
jgi:CRP-like cAMP-binding protein